MSALLRIGFQKSLKSLSLEALVQNNPARAAVSFAG